MIQYQFRYQVSALVTSVWVPNVVCLPVWLLSICAKCPAALSLADRFIRFLSSKVELESKYLIVWIDISYNYWSVIRVISHRTKTRTLGFVCMISSIILKLVVGHQSLECSLIFSVNIFNEIDHNPAKSGLHIRWFSRWSCILWDLISNPKYLQSIVGDGQPTEFCLSWGSTSIDGEPSAAIVPTMMRQQLQMNQQTRWRRSR